MCPEYTIPRRYLSLENKFTYYGINLIAGHRIQKTHTERIVRRPAKGKVYKRLLNLFCKISKRVCSNMKEHVKTINVLIEGLTHSVLSFPNYLKGFQYSAVF